MGPNQVVGGGWGLRNLPSDYLPSKYLPSAYWPSCSLSPCGRENKNPPRLRCASARQAADTQPGKEQEYGEPRPTRPPSADVGPSV